MKSDDVNALKSSSNGETGSYSLQRACSKAVAGGNGEEAGGVEFKLLMESGLLTQSYSSPETGWESWWVVGC